MRRILFLTPNPIEAANTRYRVAQYVPYLQNAGYECEISPFLSSKVFREIYSDRRYVKRSIQLLSSTLSRMADVLRSPQWDAVFVTREAMLFGPPVVEWLVRKAFRRPLIFDFDDAIHIPYSSPTYGRLATVLKCSWKTASIIRMSSHVIAGSTSLARYAEKFNDAVTVIPTVVDAEQYAAAARARTPNPVPVVGWIGSHSTAQYLEMLTPALQELARRHRFVFRVVGAGRNIEIDGVDVENRAWNLSTEVSDFAALDVGVYPIHDDEWARGKCAFKAIQYMAAGVPCIASPIGAAEEVVTHERDGLLAVTQEDWVAMIERLLTSAEDRRRLAAAGQQTVREKYSLATQAPRVLEVFRGVLR